MADSSVNWSTSIDIPSKGFPQVITTQTNPPPNTNDLPPKSSDIESDQHPKDISDVTPRLSVSEKPIVTGLDTDAVDYETVKGFLKANQNVFPTSISVIGGNLAITIEGQAPCVARPEDLVRFMRNHKGRATAPLPTCIRLFDTANKCGLQPSAFKALLQPFHAALKLPQDEQGKAVDKAWDSFRPNLALAAEVENYVAHHKGLARDIRHVGSFTDEALGSELWRDFQLPGTRKTWKDSDLSHDQKQILADLDHKQEELDKHLYQFVQDYDFARQNGDYALAYDSLHRFFQACADITDSSYWRARKETFADDLTPPGPRHPKLDLGGEPPPTPTRSVTLMVRTFDWTAYQHDKTTAISFKKRANPGVFTATERLNDLSDIPTLTKQHHKAYALDLRKVIVGAAFSAESNSNGGADPKIYAESDKINQLLHRPISDWREFKKFLTDLRKLQLGDAKASGVLKPVILNLLAHGYDEGVFALGSKTTATALTNSFASAAKINHWLAKAGFTPQDLIVVTEACNAAFVYGKSRNGLPPGLDDYRKAITPKHITTSSSITKKIKLSIYDIKKGQKPTTKQGDFRWIGRETTPNIGPSVYHQYVMGLGIQGDILSLDQEKALRTKVKTKIHLSGETLTKHLPILSLHDVPHPFYTDIEADALRTNYTDLELESDLHRVQYVLENPDTIQEDAYELHTTRSLMSTRGRPEYK